MKVLVVDDVFNNKKLSNFIFYSYPFLNSNSFFKALRNKDFRINGKRINKDCIVFKGDEVSVFISDNLLFPHFSLDIVFEDDNILILNKPSNLEVTGEYSLTSVVHSYYSDCSFLPMPCHRLDRNTTGLVLFAKNQPSLDILLDKFKKHEIKKSYLALVYGIPTVKTARIQAFLFKDNKKSLVYISDIFKKGYQKIVTSYSVLKCFDNNSCLLNVDIETGRTHQIRAHLAHLGFPIIGDGKYGINSINKSFGFKSQRLHAYKLAFVFKSDSSFLDYLDGLTFESEPVDFLKPSNL